MRPAQRKTLTLRFLPLTPARWPDLENLFGPRGACGGCWCMTWRLTRSDYARLKGEANRRAMKGLVDSGHVPGILAYHQGVPIGWCSVATRESFLLLERSRTLKRLDAAPVWSVVCLFIRRPYRRLGVSVQLLRAAARYVRRRGGRLVEGYPIVPRTGQVPDVFAWTGLASAFRQAGFSECARPSATRRIVRLAV